MGKRCVAVCCSSTNADGISLFGFPKDAAVRALWVKEVQWTRAKWTATKYSVLCSKHFEEDCFETKVSVASQFGIHKTRRLKPAAVPSIFERPSAAVHPSEMGRTLVRKRTADEAAGYYSTTVDGTSKRRKRSAYEKRERTSGYAIIIITA